MENSIFQSSIYAFLPIFILAIGGLLIYLLYARKRPLVYFKNKKTGQIESLYIGFNFFLFFWCIWLFGLFLYLRGLKKWGIVFTVIDLVYIFIRVYSKGGTEDPFLKYLVPIVGCICSIYIGIKGNELTGRHLLNNEYEFADNEKNNIELAKKKWHIE